MGPVTDVVSDVFGGSDTSSSTPAAPTVTPKPVVTPRKAVRVGEKGAEKKKKRAAIRRGVPRRLSSSVLGSVAGEETKARLGD
ncbi:MAG: hypothetical protein VW421_00955 [Gammaproteobacteria bacterium]